MEKPFLRTPLYGVISVSADRPTSNQKSLPPSPTTVSPSSTYSAMKEDIMDTHSRDRQDAILPPHIFLQPSTSSSSTIKLPDPIPLRPQLARNEHPFPTSDWTVEKQRAKDVRSGDLSLPSHEQLQGRPRSDSRLESRSKITQDARVKSAEQLATNYESVLHTRSSAMPSFNPEPYYAKSSASPMTSRITDVVDSSLCPLPLRSSGSDQIGNEVSRFSDSSSDDDSFRSSFRDSVKARAKKALHIRRSSVGSTGKRPSSSTSSHKRRSSLQQGLSDGIYDMYETLTSLSMAPSAKTKSTFDISKSRSSRLSEDFSHTPAIPAKAAKVLGATSSPIKSKTPVPKTPQTPKTPKSSKFAPLNHNGSYVCVPFSENYLRPAIHVAETHREEPSSMAGKLASVFQNGTHSIEAAVGLGSEKAKKSKSEKRREDLKRKIVVVKRVED